MDKKREEFGRWLKDHRQRAGHSSQKEFAGMLNITPVQLNRIESGVSGISAETLDKAIDILLLDPLDAYRKAGLLSGIAAQRTVETVEQALDAASYWDQKGLSDADKETLRPLLEIVDREAERLLSQPTGIRPSKAPTSKIRSLPRKRDKIDEVIDAALGFMGTPVSEADRKTIREIIEKRSAEKSDEDE